MKTIQSKFGSFVGTEHFVFVADDEVTKIHFGQQIEDILIASPEGDILVSWDIPEWKDDECLLIQSKDNLKELNTMNCTVFFIKSATGKPVKVYLTVQRN